MSTPRHSDKGFTRIACNKPTAKLSKAFPGTSFSVRRDGPERDLTIEWFGDPNGAEVYAVIGMPTWCGFSFGDLHTAYCERCGYECLAMPDRPMCFDCSEGKPPTEGDDDDDYWIDAATDDDWSEEESDDDDKSGATP